MAFCGLQNLRSMRFNILRPQQKFFEVKTEPFLEA